jgi:hypothetical protein
VQLQPSPTPPQRQLIQKGPLRNGRLSLGARPLASPRAGVWPRLCCCQRPEDVMKVGMWDPGAHMDLCLLTALETPGFRGLQRSGRGALSCLCCDKILCTCGFLSHMLVFSQQGRPEANSSVSRPSLPADTASGVSRPPRACGHVTLAVPPPCMAASCISLLSCFL